jgi:hypothetical protein
MRAKNTLITSKIIKATALLQDTMAFFEAYDPSISKEQNVQQALSSNIFGKASRSRVNDILTIFKKRYLYDTQVAASLSFMVKEGFSFSALKNILYFHTARSDKLVYDMVTKVLYTLYLEGEKDVSINYVADIVRRWVEEKKTAANWSEGTITSVAQHLLTTLRDFDILEGGTHKQIAPAYLHLGSFAYISFYLLQECKRSEEVLLHSDWKLFFFDTSQVERYFLDAHQYKLLHYQAAGSTVRLDYPTANLKEYVHVILKRTT